MTVRRNPLAARALFCVRVGAIAALVAWGVGAVAPARADSAANAEICGAASPAADAGAAGVGGAHALLIGIDD